MRGLVCVSESYRLMFWKRNPQSLARSWLPCKPPEADRCDEVEACMFVLWRM